MSNHVTEGFHNRDIAMLTLDALRIRYGEVEAVRGVDLNVGRGEIVALVGANGAGKAPPLAPLLAWYQLRPARSLSKARS